MSENLLPCPFCGKPAEARWLPINGSVKKEIFGLCGCNPCDVTFFSQTKFVEGQEKEALSQAIAAWNRRVPPQGGQPAKCPECGSNMTRFGSSDMCGPETITFFNECRRCKKVYPVVQPAEPVEGAPALEKLIEAFAHEIHYGKSGQYTPLTQLDIDIIEAARQEAANRRPADTGIEKRGSRMTVVKVNLAEEEQKLPEMTDEEVLKADTECRAGRPAYTGEDERDKKDWAQKLADKIHSAPWTPGETRELILRHLRNLPDFSHSDIEPPRVQLGYDREGDVRCYAVRRGDVLLYSGADPHAAFMAALNGDSK